MVNNKKSGGILKLLAIAIATKTDLAMYIACPSSCPFSCYSINSTYVYSLYMKFTCMHVGS